MALTVLCVTFIVFLLLGVPVAIGLGLSCMATFLVEGLPFETAVQMMTSGMNVFSFLAIPFFIFSGELMLHGGIADKIVAFARSLVGHWKGGLGLANVVASTLFGGVSGSPVADTSAMGGVMIPHDEARGLQRRVRGQRDDARIALRRVDAHVAQHDHLRIRGAGGDGNDRRQRDARRVHRRPHVRGAHPVLLDHGLHAGRGATGRPCDTASRSARTAAR